VVPIIVVLIFNCCQRCSRVSALCLPGTTKMRIATKNCNVKLSISIVCRQNARQTDSERDREKESKANIYIKVNIFKILYCSLIPKTFEEQQSSRNRQIF